MTMETTGHLLEKAGGWGRQQERHRNKRTNWRHYKGKIHSVALAHVAQWIEHQPVD